MWVMGTRIKAPFATARKTAKVLGVSKSRFKLLERLANSNTIFKAKASRKADMAGSDVVFSRHSSKSARPKSLSAKSWARLAIRNRKSKAKLVKGHSGAKA
jgi:hypothetical protein